MAQIFFINIHNAFTSVCFAHSITLSKEWVKRLPATHSKFTQHINFGHNHKL